MQNYFNSLKKITSGLYQADWLISSFAAALFLVSFFTIILIVPFPFLYFGFQFPVPQFSFFSLNLGCVHPSIASTEKICGKGILKTFHFWKCLYSILILNCNSFAGYIIPGFEDIASWPPSIHRCCWEIPCCSKFLKETCFFLAQCKLGFFFQFLICDVSWHRVFPSCAGWELFQSHFLQFGKTVLSPFPLPLFFLFLFLELLLFECWTLPYFLGIFLNFIS